MTDRCGEIIATNTSSFVAESYTLHQPPPLHYSVLPCDLPTLTAFSEQMTYFRLLLAAQGELPTEQLLAAHIRQTYTLRGNDLPWLTRAAREVSTLLQAESARLLTVLYDIEP